LKNDKKFWQGVGALFDRLGREEVNAAIIAGDRDGEARFPGFGSPLAESSYETNAKGFYSAWSGFYTRKTFAWLDKWDEEDGEDRRMRRAIEKENKRGREARVREYNTTVRMLVTFVRKCDPRVEDKTTLSPEAMEKLAREKVDVQKKKAREANEARLKEALKDQVPVQTWHTPSAQDEGFYSDEDEDQEDEGFECVACDKKFKSEKQYEAHERSKKHKKAIWELRKFMEKEDAELHLGGLSNHSVHTDGEDDEPDETTETVDIPETAPTKEMADMKITEKSDPPSSAASDAYSDEADEDEADEDGDLHPDLLKDKSKSSSTPDTPKLGKAAQKRAKKAAAAFQKAGVDSQDDGPESAFKCMTCNAGFASKGKLFDHIKLMPNHAAPALKAYGTGLGGTGGKKKKGKK
jgi:DnaJ family protein A protein 5